jgi:peptide/nickel transport system permease protein
MRGSTPEYGTPSGEAATEAVLDLRRPGPSARRRVLSLARRNPLGLFGLVVVLVMIFTALFAPIIAPYDPIAMGDDILVRPNRQHLFGTDQFGRDVFSRVVHGARVSVGISFAIVGISMVIGTFLGVVAGYYQRWPDYLLQRSGEFFHAFPALVFLLLIITVLGPSIRTLFIAFTVSAVFTGGSRVIRGVVISIKQNQYVEAARTLGASDLRIMLVHVLPNVVPLAIVLATVGLGGVILVLSGLGFLGLGVPPPNPDWGGDLSGQARTYFRTAPWLATFPGLAISVTVLAFNLLGDSLRDVFDPRMRGRRAA